MSYLALYTLLRAGQIDKVTALCRELAAGELIDEYDKNTLDAAADCHAKVQKEQATAVSKADKPKAEKPVAKPKAAAKPTPKAPVQPVGESPARTPYQGKRLLVDRAKLNQKLNALSQSLKTSRAGVWKHLGFKPQNAHILNKSTGKTASKWAMYLADHLGQDILVPAP